MHLNGREIFRLGMNTAATVADATAAARTVDTAIEGPFPDSGDPSAVGGKRPGGGGAPSEHDQLRHCLGGGGGRARGEAGPHHPPGYAEFGPDGAPALSGRLDQRGVASEHLQKSPRWGRRAASPGSNWPTWGPPRRIWAAGPSTTTWPNRPAGVCRHRPRWEPAPIDWCGRTAKPPKSTETSWHAGFRLAASRGVVALLREQTRRAGGDQYLAYDVSGADEAFGILDSGDPAMRGRLRLADPGAANPGAPTNRPPELDPIPDQKLRVGEGLRIAVHPGIRIRASDCSVSTGPGFPVGASIGETDGVVVWTPIPGGRGGGDRSGPRRRGPSLEASRSFRVTVTPAEVPDPVFTAVEPLGADSLRPRLDSFPVTGTACSLPKRPPGPGPPPRRTAKRPG